MSDSTFFGGLLFYMVGYLLLAGIYLFFSAFFPIGRNRNRRSSTSLNKKVNLIINISDKNNESLPQVKVSNNSTNPPSLKNKISNASKVIGTIPYASDGSSFNSGLARSSGYTVGEKGDERKFNDYSDALDYLRNMKVAKWRRPNEQGNWGIVTALKWDVTK